MTDFSAARHNMVENQIRTNKVTDASLIGALSELPREAFVPERARSLAYVDEDLAIGAGRYLMEPMVLARLLQELAPRPDDVALVVGSGSGYSAAVLARLCTTVVAVEENADLAARSAETLTRLEIDNAVVIEGSLTEGYAKHSPYDVILVDGAVEAVPDALLDQLAEGGRLATVLHERGIGRGAMFSRVGGIISRRVVFDAATPVLPGFERPIAFEF
ncbi:MAG: protein-L-isoaspartate O-methyltransferase [Rhodospirillaceae bacterium]|jgi:protein-L-isoaspartate(D-aspartate) O-methyltransferase|nr:protein-L-isoaspartate O-methyltransferase [Rhodospirillaceae bacterium]